MTDEGWEPRQPDAPRPDSQGRGGLGPDEPGPDELGPGDLGPDDLGRHSAEWAEPEDYPDRQEYAGYPPGRAQQPYYGSPGPGYAQQYPEQAQPYPDQAQQYADPPEQYAPARGSSSTTWLVAVAACTAVIAVGALVAVWLLLGRDPAPGTTAVASSPGVTEPQALVEPSGPTAEPSDRPDAERTDADRPSGGTRSSPSARPSSARTSSSAPSPEDPAPTLSRPAGAVLQVDLQASGQDAVDVASVLAAHGDNINSGDYAAGWAQQSSTLQSRNTSQDFWAQGVSTTQWQQLTIRDVSVDGDTATADARLRTTQAPEWGDGHECLTWDLTYTLVRNGDGWLIDRARGTSNPC